VTRDFDFPIGQEPRQGSAEDVRTFPTGGEKVTSLSVAAARAFMIVLAGLLVAAVFLLRHLLLFLQFDGTLCNDSSIKSISIPCWTFPLLRFSDVTTHTN
jgi:hypothetical protein